MSNPNAKASDDRVRAMNREMAHHRRAFAQAFAEGRAPVLDRFGRALEKGSLIVWRPPQDLVFQVDDIAPVLDPNQPAGIIRVMISMAAPVMWQAGQTAPDVIVVGKTKEGHTVLDATKEATTVPDGTVIPPDPNAPPTEEVAEPAAQEEKKDDPAT